MCCGQKRATLTTPPSPAAREIPNFRRNTSAEVGFHAAYAPVAPQHAPQASPPAPPVARAMAPPESPGPNDASVYLQYREQPLIRVRGLATGRVYEFSGKKLVQAVDERDAAALLQTRLFQRCASPQVHPAGDDFSP
jgi:hypothetical protein